MRLSVLFAFLLAFPVYGESKDLLRFKNGDQLHGVFSGITEDSTVLWKRDDVSDEVKLRPNELRQVVLRGGRPKQSLQDLSHIGTINGDRIPGMVRELNAEKLILETEFGGMLEIPRNEVGLIAPSPLGGRVLYNGPFQQDEWEMITLEQNEEHAPEEIMEEEAAEKVAKKGAPLWKFSGSAWYWQDETLGTALSRKSGVPDRAVIRFDLAWKNRLALAVAFHSDFVKPAEEEDEDAGEDAKPRRLVVHPGQPASLPVYFGNSYVLQIYSNYVNLYRVSYDSKGKHRMPEQIRSSHTNMRLGDSGQASFELRCNRDSGEISLFVDGEFIAQWSEVGDDAEGDEELMGSKYTGLGDGMGFLVLAGDSAVRISEIIVAEWNGMPDAARSLQADDIDIVLLANGTDRLAGTVREITDGKLRFESRYGEFEFPLEDVAEVRFAMNQLAEVVPEPSGSIIARMYPIGRITGLPIRASETSLSLLSRSAGEIELNLDSAVMLEFEPSISFLDDWDIEL